MNRRRRTRRCGCLVDLMRLQPVIPSQINLQPYLANWGPNSTDNIIQKQHINAPIPPSISLRLQERFKNPIPSPSQVRHPSQILPPIRRDNLPLFSDLRRPRDLTGVENIFLDEAPALHLQPNTLSKKLSQDT